MIILNGVRYRLTTRGRITIGALLALVIILLVILNGNKHGTLDGRNDLKQPSVVSATGSQVAKGVTPKLATTATAGATPGESVVTEPKAFSIFFGPDSTTLEAKYESSLNQIAEYLKATPAAQVTVEGSFNAYPDLKGDYFEALSMDRAMNVAGYLKQIKDVPEEQVKVVNLGGKKQVNKDSSKAELAKNRRVDISIRAPK